MKALLERESPEKGKKKQAAVGQTPLLSKVKANALPRLARAPISKPAMEPPPPAAQLAGPAPTFQKPPPITAHVGRAGTNFSKIAAY